MYVFARVSANREKYQIFIMFTILRQTQIYAVLTQSIANQTSKNMKSALVDNPGGWLFSIFTINKK